MLIDIAKSAKWILSFSSLHKNKENPSQQFENNQLVAKKLSDILKLEAGRARLLDFMLN